MRLAAIDRPASFALYLSRRLVLLAFCGLLTGSPASADHAVHVLILHSYHPSLR